MARNIDEFGCVAACDLERGDRIAVCYGIVTVLSVETVDVKTNRRRIVPMESQPPIEVYAGYPVRLAKSK